MLLNRSVVLDTVRSSRFLRPSRQALTDYKDRATVLEAAEG